MIVATEGVSTRKSIYRRKQHARRPRHIHDTNAPQLYPADDRLPRNTQATRGLSLCARPCIGYWRWDNALVSIQQHLDF